MNKTTSFSKISATRNIKNDNINLAISNSSSSSSVSTTNTNKTQTTSANARAADSFFIDSISEKSKQQYSGSLFEPPPVNNNNNLIKNFNSNHESQIVSRTQIKQQQQQNIKNWRSDTNISNIENNAYEPNEYDDYDLDEIDAADMQFSDHAGLFDPINQNEHEEDEADHAQEDLYNDYINNQNCNSVNEQTNQNRARTLINNYDIYKVTKKNYKLTYDNSNKQFLNNFNHRRNRVQNEDSLVSSALMQQSSNYDENNDEYVDYYQQEEEEEDAEFDENLIEEEPGEEEEEEEYQQENDKVLINKYIISKMNGNNNNNNILDESIMNWSMKLSNCNYKRSQSRSPIRSTTSSQFNFNNQIEFQNQQDLEQYQYILRQLSLNSQQQHAQPSATEQEEQKKRLSTTSWGKLKHSKSSSSNIGGSVTKSNEDQDSTSNKTTNHRLDNQKTNVKNEPISFVQSVHNPQSKQPPKPTKRPQPAQPNTETPSLSSASLYRLYQNSRALDLNSSNSEASSNSFEQQQQQFIKNLTKLPAHNQPTYYNNNNETRNDNTSSYTNRDTTMLNNTNIIIKTKFKNETNANNFNSSSSSSDAPLNVNKFSYSSNEQERKPRRQHNLDLNPNPARTTSFSQLRQRSLSSCAIAAPPQHKSNNNMTSVNIKKASIGIQHPPPNTEPTIVCMLVDHKSRATNKDIIAAARAAKAAVKAHRSTSLFSTKSSLPDLAFLKDYADDKPKPKPNNTNAQVLTKAVTNPSIGAKKPEQPSMIPVLQTPVSSDLLKRKTLKSIKRYRQTKQNTEPCAFAMPPNTADSQENRILYDYNQLKQRFIESAQAQANQKAASNHSSSSSTSSNATNTSGYVSTNANTPFQRQSSLPSHHSAHVLATSKESKEKPALKSCLKRKESNSSQLNNQCYDPSQQTPAACSMIVNKSEDLGLLSELENASVSMFVPFVGYLFSCDQSSSTRYGYYNNLEKTRRIKAYKQIVNKNYLSGRRPSEKENESDEDFEDEEEFEEDEDENEEENGEPKAQDKQTVCSSRSDNDLRVKKSVTFLAHVIEHKKQNSLSPSSTVTTESSSNTPTTNLNKTSPFYDHNYANSSPAPLLQYNSLIAMLKSSKLPKQEVPAEPAKEIRVQQSPQPIRKLKNKSVKSKSTQPFPINEHHYFKKSQVIDADSISLASLSESPPSEFKFSDDEDSTNSSMLNRQISNETQSFNQQQLQQQVAAKFLASNVNKSNEVDVSKNIQLQQIKINQLNQIRNTKKNFHSILLKDAKLNNLKEILVEIKQQQQKIAQAKQRLDTPPTSSPSSSTSSSSSSPITTSTELKETIERLAQFLFEFLKQGLKPVSADSIVIPGVTPLSPQQPCDSPSPAHKQKVVESNTLSTTYAQYAQVWDLIEHTMNHNLAQSSLQTSHARVPLLQPQLQMQQPHIFYLPKEAYLNMFQEINRYANSANQTYLIDSGINTSQLRRKHHFMVMLMSLKFKFQLFIINLLNHRQLANWFEYLSKDRNLLKSYYDLKPININNTGDSGVGEFMCTSSSSTSSSINYIDSSSNTANLLASLSITSLANVSIFENDEYFNYFHKLIQQFSYIDFNLKLLKEETPVDNKRTQITSSFSAQTIATPPSSAETKPPTIESKTKPEKPLPPTRKSSSSTRRDSNETITTPVSTFSHHQPQPCHSTSGLLLKNIKSRFNIKSWFSSSHNHNNIPTSVSSSNIQSNTVNINTNGRGYGTVKSIAPPAPSTTRTLQNPAKTNNHKHNLARNICPNPTIGIGSGVGVLISGNQNSLMKHSLSEPSLNALIN